MRYNNGSGYKETILPTTYRKSTLNQKFNQSKKRKKKKPRGKTKIPHMSYRMYMGSAYWVKRKNDYFGKYGKSCAVCGKKKGTTLHHTFYNKKIYGSEPDTDLVPLCGQHHHEYHETHGVQKDMRDSTSKYIEHARQMFTFDTESDWIKSL